MESGCIERVALLGSELELVRIRARRPGLPALVFLHEGLGSAQLWRAFPTEIAARTGCEAIVYSRAGNGFSSVVTEPRTFGYMHEEALSVLPALLGKLDVDEAVLVGHSDGASIALIFAADHPEAVRALVLEAPHLFVERLSLESIAAIRTQYQTTNLRERMSRHHADADRTFYGWNDVWLSPGFSGWNIEEQAARVTAPILAVQGADDQYGTLAQLDSLARLARGLVDRVILARCGHAPHVERPGFVRDVTADWIEGRLAQ